MRSLVVTAVAGGMATGPATAHAGLQAAGQLLVVRSYDAFGVPSGDLKMAQTITSAILRDAGIDVVWRNCARLDDQATTACQEVLEPTELVVRILTSGSQRFPSPLGFSLVDVQRRTGSLATIYADRVRALATESAFDFAKLLGRAIAHEIGHLLLGTSDHSNRGLMRSNWSTAELRRDQPWDWRVSRSEATQMRQALATRSSRPTEPATLVAGLNRVGEN